MIKTVTVKKLLCLCDICGESTGFEGEQGYATTRKYHFCKTHDPVEAVVDGLMDLKQEDLALELITKIREKELKGGEKENE